MSKKIHKQSVAKKQADAAIEERDAVIDMLLLEMATIKLELEAVKNQGGTS